MQIVVSVDWTSNRWDPTAFLIDGSKIESVFGNTRVLKYTRHSTETLRVKLSHGEEVLFYMKKAVFAENLSDCQKRNGML